MLILGILTGCTGSDSAVQTLETLAISNAGISSVDATSTSIAYSINDLFTATAAAGATATQFAIANPSAIPTTDPNQHPAIVARLWLTAFLQSDGTTLGRYTCQAKAEDVSQAAMFTGVLGGFLNQFIGENAPGTAMEVDLSNVTFEIFSQSANQAVVRASGEAVISVGGGFQTTRPNGSLILVYEDGRWKWCDFGE